MALADVCGLNILKTGNSLLPSAVGNNTPNFLVEAEFASQNFTIPYNFDVSVFDREFIV